jgi:hypothetical protein
MARVERAVFDAVFQRQTDKVDLLDRSLLQIMSQTGVSSMDVVEKRAVARYTQQKVRDREDALAKSPRRPLPTQPLAFRSDPLMQTVEVK